MKTASEIKNTLSEVLDVAPRYIRVRKALMTFTSCLTNDFFVNTQEGTEENPNWNRLNNYEYQQVVKLQAKKLSDLLGMDVEYYTNKATFIFTQK